MLLLYVIFTVLVVVSGTACPASHAICYPSDCCAQFQACDGDTLYSPEPTAEGTVCLGGYQVYPSACTTPCASSPPATTTTKASTSKSATSTTTTAKSTTSKPSTTTTSKPSTSTTTSKPSTTTTLKPSTTSTSMASSTSKTVTTTKSPSSTVAATSTAGSTAAVTSASATSASVSATSASVTSASATSASATSASATSGSISTTGGVVNCSLAQIFSQSDFDQLFPNANGGSTRTDLVNQHAIFYYTNIITAAQSYPDFGCTGSEEIRKRELAAFLAQTSQETSGWWAGQPYNWGYYFSTELGCTNVTCTGYCDETSTLYPCAPGGPLQLSWNYNYGQVSEALFGNNLLLLDPDQLFASGVIAFSTSLWFWMTPQSPKPSCHDAMTGLWIPSPSDIAVGRQPGFGMTTNIINGGIECNVTTPATVDDRIGYYTTYATWFNVTTGDNLYCNSIHTKI